MHVFRVRDDVGRCRVVEVIEIERTMNGWGWGGVEWDGGEKKEEHRRKRDV